MLIFWDLHLTLYYVSNEQVHYKTRGLVILVTETIGHCPVHLPSLDIKNKNIIFAIVNLWPMHGPMLGTIMSI